MPSKLSNKFAFLLVLFSLKTSYGQKNDTILKAFKNVIYFDIGKQMLFSISYERVLLDRKYYSLTSQIGYGAITGDNAPKEPGHHNILTGIHNLFGNKGFYLQLGIAPTIYFYGNTTFININGDFGFRYQNRHDNLFAQITFNPILFTTHNNTFDLPFGTGIGYRW
jgi:hypothetical protein